jgi:hypothetical protein
MSATLLCVALLVPGYGEKDVKQEKEQEKGTRKRGRTSLFPPSSATTARRVFFFEDDMQLGLAPFNDDGVAILELSDRTACVGTGHRWQPRRRLQPPRREH